MRVTTASDPAAAAGRCAESLVLVLREAIDARGVAHLALNGGSTPRPVYRRGAVARALGAPDPGTPASLLEREGLELIVDEAAGPHA